MEQVQKQIVPEGYKQTEVGLIPEDWEALTLGDVSSVRMCKRIFSYQTSKYGDVPFYKIGTFGREPDAYISSSLYMDYKERFSYPKLGDVLISASGTLGRTVIYDGEPAYFQDSNIVWLDINKNILINDYLYHYYQNIRWASSEGSTISRLYNDVIQSTFIAVPLIKEQTAIANALSDVDALISELEKLIAKKQAIKTATMQQLLTGRTRLPQFATHPDGTPKGTQHTELGGIPEDWELNSFGKLFEPRIERKRIPDSEAICFIGMQDVSEKAKIINAHVMPYKVLGSGFTYFERGDVLVAKITPCFENGKGARTEKLTNKFGLGSTEFHVLRSKTEADVGFIYYWTVSTELRKTLEHEMIGSAGHRRVPFSALQNYLLPIPPDKQEQTAIAQILTDMDEEISALEQRLTKTRDIKQGMMQELLTGKTRLV